MNVDHLALALILAVALWLFWTQKLRTDLTALVVTLSLIWPWPHPGGTWRGILTYQEGFSGFGSVAVVMVGAMFIFGAAMVRTGAVEVSAGRLLHACARSELMLQLAIFLSTTFVSMFINDTTVVLLFMPPILSICKERNLAPSRYLLCAAYGSLLGGQWTLIGTRSNIIISDYLRVRSGVGLDFFDFTPVAAVVFVACLIYFYLVGRHLLPRPEDTSSADEALGREYLTEVMVTPTSPTTGRSLDELGLMDRHDLTVLEVIRGDNRMPARGWIRLEPNDVLMTQGPVPTIGKLLKSPDFQLMEELQIGDKTLRSVDLVTVEALLPPGSSYAGATLQEVNFNNEFGFTVMGISRHGTTLHDRPMAVRLEFGDSLLLLGHIAGLDRLRGNTNLILLGHQSFPPLRKRKAALTLLLMAGVIITAVTGVVSPAVSIPTAALLTILLGCIKVRDAYSHVDWQALVTVAGMIPLGLALEKSGAAEALAHAAVAHLAGFGPLVVLGTLLLVAVVLTQLIENAAVAIIVAPLAYQVALETAVDPRPFMIGLAICVSAAFCTPVAHESTILVMGPGRYKFKHYLQIGGAMAVLTWLIATLVTPMVWPFR